MINIADNPAVRAQIEQALARQDQLDAVPERQYARAPDGAGYVPDGSGDAGRPPATQGGTR